VKYRPPTEAACDGITVRVDTGVYEGGEISLFYDPIIAKLITHAETRSEAIAAQSRALDAYYIDGIRHNIPFLSALMQHPRWQEGRLSTGFITEEYPDGFHPIPPEGDRARIIAAVGAAVDHVLGERKRRINGQMTGRLVTRERRRVVWLGATEVELAVDRVSDAIAVRFIEANGAEGPVQTVVSSWRPGDPVWSGTVGDKTVAVQVRPVPNGFVLAYHGVEVTAFVYTASEAQAARLMPIKAASDTGKMLRCPMPGLVLSIEVQVGQEVKAGETLAVVEAMKMENVLRAERDGKVEKIHARPGDSLAVDAVILEFG
jgi:propionyl-CoA carboxylase alpha chain